MGHHSRYRLLTGMPLETLALLSQVARAAAIQDEALNCAFTQAVTPNG